MKKRGYLPLFKEINNSLLYSNKVKLKPGQKPRDQALIALVIEMKKRNPTFGYLRISLQIYESFNIEISL
ncbi:MAG: hypothetical protein JKY67_22550 [Pseudomonadales bacterium]|nr:hypothetical protein [Pseudomonadales bacterium]